MIHRYYNKILQKIFGLQPLDVPGFGLAWGMRFLYHVGLVIAWTLITALFVESFGIMNLVWLFVLDLSLLLLGTLFLSFAIRRFSLQKLILYILIGAGISFAVALLAPSGSLLFFLGLVVCKDLFYARLDMTLNRQDESLFSPVKAQKLLPAVETSVTMGTIVGAGLTIALLYLGASAHNALWLWGGTILAMIGFMWDKAQWLHEIPHFRRHKDSCRNLKRNPLIIGLRGIRKKPYLWQMALFVFLQAFVFIIVEFEFTKDLQVYVVEHHQEMSSMLTGVDLQTSLFDRAQVFAHKIENMADRNVEHMAVQTLANETLAHSLGVFHLLFGLLALFVQLFITPKALNKYGVASTMVWYFATLFLTSLAFIFGWLGVAKVRMFHHGVHTLGVVPYNMSFYSLTSGVRESVRLVLHGVLRPLGILAGVLMLMFVPMYFGEFMLGATVLMLVVSFFLKKNFTTLSAQTLDDEKDLESKLHAIEILGQKGHDHPARILMRYVKDKNNTFIVRDHMIQVLTEINDPEVVHEYVALLEDDQEKEPLKMNILQSMLDMPAMEQYWSRHDFGRKRMVKIVEGLVQHQNRHMQRLAVMSLFHLLPYKEVLKRFESYMETGDDFLQSIALRSLANLCEPSLQKIVEPYLQVTSPRVRSHAVIALWKHGDRNILRGVIKELLLSEDTEDIIGGLYAAGEVRCKKCESMVQEIQLHTDKFVRLQALIALAKMKNKESIEGILHIIFGDDEGLAKSAYRMLRRVGPEMRDTIREAIKTRVSKRVSDILQAKDHLSQDHLDLLHRLYWFAGQYDDMLAVAHAKPQV